MSQTHSIFWLALVYIPVAVLVCGLVTWRARQQAAESHKIARTLNERLTAAEKQLDKATQQVSEQGRRLAWLELCLRQGRLASGETAKPADVPRPTMSEQRHRVLVLARRGMEPELIAETLGIPYGEVELIISLNAAA